MQGPGPEEAGRGAYASACFAAALPRGCSEYFLSLSCEDFYKINVEPTANWMNFEDKTQGCREVLLPGERRALQGQAQGPRGTARSVLQFMAPGHRTWVGGLQNGPFELGLDVGWGFSREGWGWEGGPEPLGSEGGEAEKARQGLVWGRMSRPTQKLQGRVG